MRRVLLLATAAAGFAMTACEQKVQQGSNVAVECIEPVRSIQLEEFDVLKTSQFVVCDSMLITNNIGDKQKVTCISLSDGTSFKAAHVGSGPGEVSNYTHLTAYKGEPYLIDINYSKCFKLNVDKPNGSAELSMFAPFPYMMMMSANIVGPGLYVTSTYNDSCLVMLCDSARMTKSVIDYPTESEVSKFSPAEQSSIWGGSSYAVSPDCKHLFAGYAGEGVMYFASIEPDGFKVDKKEVRSLSHITKGQFGRLQMSDDDVRHVVSAAAIDDESVAVLYCGHTKAQRDSADAMLNRDIYVYSWDGQLRRHLQTSVDLNALYYSQTMKKLYALAKEPECHILEFDLK